MILSAVVEAGGRTLKTEHRNEKYSGTGKKSGDAL